MYMNSDFIKKNIRLAAIITILIGICGIFAWNQFFPSLQSTAIALPPEVIAQIDRIQSDRDALLGQKKSLISSLIEGQKNIESVEENLAYNKEILHNLEEEFQKINNEIVLNESKKGKDMTQEEYEIALASLLQKKQDILLRKKQTQSLQDDVMKQRNTLSERISQSDLGIRQIDIQVRWLDTQIARIIAQAE